MMFGKLVMRGILFISLLLLTAFQAVGQLTVSLSVVDAECSSNGQISAEVTGGSGDYTFTLRNECGDVFLPKRTPIFTTLPPCQYTMEIIDQETKETVIDVIEVQSTYIPLDGEVIIENCEIVVKASNGSRPYTYSYATAKEGPFLSNGFDSILPPIESDVVWVNITDNCGNDILISGSTEASRLTSFTTEQQVEGMLIIPEGGSTPYTFTLKSTDGEVTNNTGFFPWDQIGCNATIDIMDQCGLDTLKNRFLGIEILGADYCAKFTEGIVEFTVESGNGPFTYSVITPTDTFSSTNNILTNIPTIAASYRFVIEDACGQKVDFNSTAPYRLNFNPAFRGCADPKVAFSVGRNCTGDIKFPLTLECLSCEPVQTIESINNFFVFEGQRPGNWDIRLTDACDAQVRCRDTVELEIIPACDSIVASVVDNFYCDNQLVSRREIKDNTFSYILLNSADEIVATNSTGVFTNLGPDTYTVIGFGSCLAVENTVTLGESTPINPELEYYVNYTNLGMGCGIYYDIKIEKEQGPYVLKGGPNGNFVQVLNNFDQDNCKFYDVDGLLPGRYTLKSFSSCGEITINLPEVDFEPIGTVTINATCPTDSRISIEKQLWTTTDWQDWFRARGINISNSSMNDRVFIDGLPYFVSDIDGLEPGPHTILFYPGFASVPNQCFTDEVRFDIPPYVAPSLSMSQNLLCDTAVTADILLDIQGSTPTFFIRTIECEDASEMSVMDTIGSPQTILLEDAPIGVYCFNIKDGCNTVRDYQFEVGYYTDEILVEYRCDSLVELTVDSLPVPFSWRNESNELFDTGSNAIVSLPDQDTSFSINIDLEECVVERTVTVSPRQIIPELEHLHTSNQLTFCVGDSLLLNASTDTPPISWNTGEQGPSIIVNTPGIYTAQVTNELGCTKTVSIEVDEVENPIPQIIAPTGLCLGDSTIINLSNNYTSVQWSTGTLNSDSIFITEAGTYSVLVQDSLGCFGRDLIEIEPWMLPEPEIDAPEGICRGDFASLQLASPFDFVQWTSGNAMLNQETIQISQAGQYQVLVRDELGCEGYDTVMIADWLLPNFEISGESLICQNATTFLSTSESFPNYSWSTGATSESIEVGAGTYRVTATDDNGCQNIETFTIEERPVVTATISGDTTLCIGDTAYVHIQIEGITGSSSISLASLDTDLGTFSFQGANVTIPLLLNQSAQIRIADLSIDGFPCAVNFNGLANITIQALPTPEIDAPLGICVGSTTMLSLNQNYAFVEWAIGNATSNMNSIQISQGGKYVVLVRDELGCEAQDSVVIEDWNLPNFNISGASPICQGASTPLSVVEDFAAYLWNTGSIEKTIDVGAGNYEVTVTDENGCQNTNAFSIEERPEIAIEMTGDTTVCLGDSALVHLRIPGLTGSATVTLATPNRTLGTFSFQGSNVTIPILVDQTEQVQVIAITAEDYPCSITINQSIQIEVRALPQPRIVAPEGLCRGNTALLSLEQPFAFVEWTNNNISLNQETLQIIEAGQYDVLVRDDLGCEGATSIIIEDWLLPEVNITGENLICEGATSIITAESNSSNFRWSTGANTQIIEVGDGTYRVTVTDGNNCESIDIFTIEEQLVISASLTGDTTVCVGDSTYVQVRLDAMATEASVSLASLSGDLGTYSFQGNQVVIPILLNQSEQIRITSISIDGFNCLINTNDIVSVTVRDLPEPNILAPAGLCAGTTATLSLSESFPFTKWFNDGDTAVLASIPINQAGAYGVEVRDELGCTGFGSIDIEAWQLPEFEISGDALTCPGSTIPLTIEGSFSTYVWSSGENTPSILAGIGTYQATVTDVNGCENTNSFTIEERPGITAILSGDTTICFGGTALLNVTLEGLSGSASVSFTDGTNDLGTLNFEGNQATFPISLTNPAQVEIANVTASNFPCPITPQGNVTINLHDIPEPQIIAPAGICPGDTTILSLDQTYNNIEWSNGMNGDSILIDQTGTYSVQLKDDKGCDGMASVLIEQWSIPDFDIVGERLACEGGASTLTIDESFARYEWSTGQNTQTIEAVKGSYTATVTDENGCQNTQSFIVEERPSVSAILSGDTVVCIGDTAYVKVQLIGISGQATVTLTSATKSFDSWSFEGNETIIPVLVDQSTRLRIQSIQLSDYPCLIIPEGEVMVSLRELPSPSIIAPEGICREQTAFLKLEENYEFIRWSNGKINEEEIPINQAGSYLVEVRDNLGCRGIDSVIVNDWLLPKATILGEALICPESSTFLTVDDKYPAYQWNTGEQTRTIQATAGNYTATITDDNGCQNTTSFLVEDLPEVSATLSGDTTICKGDTALLRINLEGLGGQGAATLAATTMNMNVWELNGNEATLPLVLETSDQFRFSEFSLDGYPCPINLNGEAIITVRNLPAPFLSGPSGICKGDTAEIVLENAFQSISWSTGAFNQYTISIVKAGEYSIEVQDDFGCIGNESILIEALQDPEFGFLGDTVLCAEDITSITVDESFRAYQWDNGSTNRSITVAGGTYEVTVTDNNGCIGSKQVFVEERPPLTLYLGQDQIILLGQEVIITPISNQQIADWVWYADGEELTSQTNLNLNNFYPQESTSLVLYAIDDNDCTVKEDVFITIDNSLKVFPPSGFSPNGDGKNDTFTLFTSSVQVEEIVRLSIFNRWGSLVFDRRNFPSNVEGLGWDGQLRGEKAPSGVYVWRAEVRLIDGTIEQLQGDITLVR